MGSSIAVGIGSQSHGRAHTMLGMAAKILDPAVLPSRPTRDSDSDYDGYWSGHFHQGDKYSVYRERGTASWLLFYTVSGSGYFRFADDELRLSSAGQLAIYRPRVEQNYGTM